MQVRYRNSPGWKTKTLSSDGFADAFKWIKMTCGSAVTGCRFG
jgi:hypothetical protein